MPTQAIHPADMPRIDYLRRELFLLHEEIAEMVERGSWQAVVAARRLALQYRNEIEDLRKVESADFEPQTVDQVVEELAKLPDAIFGHPMIRARVAGCA